MANSNGGRPRQRGSALGIRAIVLLYVLYLIYGIVAAYVRGDSDALSLPLTILCAAILGIADVVLLVFTYRQWKAQSDASQETPSEPDEADDHSL